MNSIFPFFKWINDSWLSKVINDSTWVFPAIEGVHITALALLFGSILVMNLRLMGVVMRDRPLQKLSRELDAWIFCSLVVILVTGGLLFVSEAVRSFHSGPFRIKMVFLIAAVLFHYTVSRRLVRGQEQQVSPVFCKAAGAVSIVLWMTVGFAGRAIGFF